MDVQLKISNKSDYALKAILDLCYRYDSGETTSIFDISKRQNIPDMFLEQIMLLLKKSGVVLSKRGKGGGFLLNKNPKEIVIGEILRVVEGPIEPDALKYSQPNKSYDQIVFQEVWQKVTQAISDIVDSVSFADIMDRIDELKADKSEFNYMI